METGKPSLLSSFKSKKLLRNEEYKTPMISPEKEAEKVSAPASTPLGAQTPCKAANPIRRLRNRSAAMSIKEVRQAALKPQERGSTHTSGNDPEPGIKKEKEPIARSKKKSADSKTTLAEKYELLVEFFIKLDISIRLLQLRRSATIFTNISSLIEKFTNRRFTHSHLAQLKFIMPEAIVIEKVFRHDEMTGCRKPDLHITVNVEAIDSKSISKSSSINLQLVKMFRDKLLEFFKSHPEVDQVPEETLPEPFSRLKNDPNPVQSSAPSLMSTETPDVGNLGQTVKASHFPELFKTGFSQRQIIVNLESADQEKASDSFGSESQHSKSSPSGKETGGVSVNSHSDSLPTPLPETPIRRINPTEDMDHASTPKPLMIATPGLRPPKRCCVSPDDEPSKLPNKLTRRPLNRSLTFDSPVKTVKAVEGKSSRSNISSTDDDIYDILPADLIQSIQERERLAETEKDPAISQAKWRKQMLASLPKLFDMVRYIFQSIRESAITKEELIHKIITDHLDIVDRREVEDQLRLLQEFAPEWISEKADLIGDRLICVNKSSCHQTIHRRLLEAR